MASAMALSTAARSVSDVSPQASLAAWAASRASSTSSAVDLATSVKGLPVTGLTFCHVLALDRGAPSARR